MTQDNPSTAFTFQFEGEAVTALPGQTIAGALVASGRKAHSRAKDGAPRGYYCGMGVCHDCTVRIDGLGEVRSCLTKAAPGLAVSSGSSRVDAAAAGVRADPADPQDLSADILVIGAGPGGLAAAIAARNAGADVLVVDERSSAGGQFFKQPATTDMPRALIDRQSRDGADLIQAAREAGVQLANDTLVWGAFRNRDLTIEVAMVTAGQNRVVRPKTVIIATGAYERPALVPGWTLPGAMTPGGAQALIRMQGIAPGRNVVISGNGPLNLQLADELLRLGVAQITVVESAPPPWRQPAAAARMAAQSPVLSARGLGQMLSLRRRGVKIFWSSGLVAIEGAEIVEGARIASLGRDGAVMPGTQRLLPADAVLSSSGFIGASEIARQLGVAHIVPEKGFARLEALRADDGATERDDVFVVGEAGGFGGAHVAMAQGQLAGAAAARHLGLLAPEPSDARARLTRHKRFQHHLWQVFASPSEDLSALPDDTLVCRCEAITLGDLRGAGDRLAAPSVQGLKHLSRVGMGRCQGRYCGPMLQAVLGGLRPRIERDILLPQVPVRPVPASAIARAQPEWLGHKREALPDFPPAGDGPLPMRKVDVAVIGAGIAGISTALFLARGGASVAILDSGRPNGVASGGNAGSLHGQLLSFDFARPTGGVTPQIATLNLQRHAIALWQDLQAQSPIDFEMAITGGLMVAETKAELERLAIKAEVEREQGIDSQLIDADALYRREPGLGPGFLGAVYCFIEGKINPLIASHALLDEALAAGASMHAGCAVTAIEVDAGGFRLVTPRGAVLADRVVNAAGAFAGRIGALLDLDIPVHGAPLQMIATEAAEPMVSHLLAHASRHLTLKQARNGNLLIGGGWSAGLDPITQKPRTLRSSIEGNLAVAQAVLPGVGALKVLRSWAAMNIDIDGAPILGEDPRRPGFFTAVGANGYTLGPLFGQITAGLLQGTQPRLDIEPFSINRFDRH